LLFKEEIKMPVLGHLLLEVSDKVVVPVEELAVLVNVL